MQECLLNIVYLCAVLKQSANAFLRRFAETLDVLFLNGISKVKHCSDSILWDETRYGRSIALSEAKDPSLLLKCRSRWRGYVGVQAWCANPPKRNSEKSACFERCCRGPLKPRSGRVLCPAGLPRSLPSYTVHSCTRMLDELLRLSPISARLFCFSILVCQLHVIERQCC